MGLNKHKDKKTLSAFKHSAYNVSDLVNKDVTALFKVN